MRGTSRSVGPLLWAGACLLLASALRDLAPSDHRAGVVAPGLALTASVGHPSLAATGAWMLIVNDYTSDRLNADQIGQGVRAIGDLDPSWPMPWVYGSLMIGAMGELHTQRDLLLGGQGAFPEEPWFPYSLGMLALNQGDRAAAATRLERAAALDGEGSIHGLAAQALGTP